MVIFLHVKHALSIFGKIMAKHAMLKVASVVVALLLFCMASMYLFEGWNPWKTTWWYVVTVATVGYGDASPATQAGQIVGMITIILGVSAGAAGIGVIANSVVTAGRRRMKGFGDYSKYEDHTIVMGWQGHRTMRVLNQLCSENKDCPIVLCSESLEERPVCLPDNIVFVRGLLGADDTLHRSGVRTSRNIIINGKDDKETSLAALAVLTADNDGKKATVAVYLEDPDNAAHIHRLEQCFNTKVSIVRSVSSDLLVREIHDPGVSTILGQLLDNTTDRNVYKLDLDRQRGYQDVVDKISWHDIPVIAAVLMDDKIVVAPAGSPLVKAIYVIHNKRPTLDLLK